MKAKARSSIRTHKSVARTASSAAEQLHYMHSKKGFGLLREHSEMGLLVGFKLRLRRAGGYNNCKVCRRPVDRPTLHMQRTDP